MTIYDGKLFVADTDNHRIVVYDSNTLLELFSFTSPIQHYCDSVNVYTSGNNYCSNELRNLPTSIAIFDEKIFVSYGFQNDIQVFDLEGNYLWKFGSYGSQDGEFNGVYNIATSDDKLYVADSENHRIQIFDSEGKFVKQFSTNVDNTSTSTPYDLSIFDDRIFVTGYNTTITTNGGHVFFTGYQATIDRNYGTVYITGNRTTFNGSNAGTIYVSGANTTAYFSGDGTIGVNKLILDYDNLPTSDPSKKGQVWRDSATLKISAG